MSYSLGVYDLLANIIPGGVYLTLLYFGLTWFTAFNYPLSEINTWYAIPFTVAAYVVGIVIDPVAKNLWYKRFKGRKSQVEIINELNAEHETIEFTDVKIDWGLLSEYIKHNDAGIYDGVRRMSAIHILMRNISFSAFLVFLMTLGDVFKSGFRVEQVAIGVSVLVFSFLAYKQARRFDDWHYKSIYHAIAGMKLKAEDLPVKLKGTEKEKKEVDGKSR